MKLIQKIYKTFVWRTIAPLVGHQTRYIVPFLLIILLVGCSDEGSNVPNGKEEGELLTVGFAISTQKAMTFFGNDVSEGTRAVDTSLEGTMSNLYVVAVKIEDGTYNQSTGSYNFTKRETPALLSTEVNPMGDTYVPGGDYVNKYNINLYPGKYKFYVLANFDLYLSRFGHVSDFLTLSDLETINLNFQANTPLAPGHLPMACLPADIEWSTNSNSQRQSVKNVTDNLIEITSSDINIYANMQFQCSKVRYTILFDNEEGGISEAFGNQSIRFNVDHNLNTVASNLRKQTYLLDHKWTEDEFADALMKTSDTYQAYPNGSEGTVYDKAYWSIDLARYKFKDKDNDGKPDFNENYPEKPNDDSLEEWTGTTDEWIQTSQRVWQGICYLPENNDRVDHTLLAFPYVIDKTVNGTVEQGNWQDNKFKMLRLFGDNTSEKHYPGMPSTGGSGNYPDASGDNDYSSSEEPSGTTNHGLVRGMMYDVVAKVVNPEDLELDIIVYINILSWTHHTSDVTGW